MNPTRFRSKTTPWRVQVSGRYFPDRKRKAFYFKTEKEAVEFCNLFKYYNPAAIKAAELLLKKHRGQIKAAELLLKKHHGQIQKSGAFSQFLSE